MSRRRPSTGVLRRAVRCQSYPTAAARRLIRPIGATHIVAGFGLSPTTVSKSAVSVLTHGLIAPALIGSDLWLPQSHLRARDLLVIEGTSLTVGTARIASRRVAKTPTSFPVLVKA